MLTACAICRSERWVRLPDPGPQSIASDWRIVPQPLGKHACEVCGVAVRPAASASLDALYVDRYALYAHAPGGMFEHARQRQYASWIVRAIGRAPRRVLDVGCGNGSLLLALREAWPGAELRGCDPSAESIAHAAGSNLNVWRGTAETLRPDLGADLIVTVNVIEHTADPIAFVRHLTRAAAPDASVVVICPDAGTPDVELLFIDHLWSFAAEHLSAVLTRAGCVPVAASESPRELGRFQMIVARTNGVPAGEIAAAAGPRLTAGRTAYLERWRALDARLAERVGSGVVCFGTGEAAGLLRCYAPTAWGRVRACTSDAAVDGWFGDVPIVSLDSVAPETPILVGVRAQDQNAVAARLVRRFSRVTTWYDLAGSDV